MTVEQIASYLGISESTFHRMREANFHILTAYKKGRARKIYKYAKTLENKALERCKTSYLRLLMKSEKELIRSEYKNTYPNLFHKIKLVSTNEI
jgi:excisionase family DNA binding protein